MSKELIDTISGLGSALGAIASLLVFFSTYELYRRSRNDEKATLTRSAITRVRTNLKKVNKLLTTELLHELAYSMIFSHDLENILIQFYDKILDPNESEEKIKMYIESKVLFTFPLHTPMTNKIESLLDSIESDSVLFQQDLPAFFRFNHVFRSYYLNYLRAIKKLLSMDITWIQIIQLELRESDKEYTDFNGFKYRIAKILTYISGKNILENWQPEIDIMLRINDQITDKYLSLSNDKMIDIIKKESRIKLKSPQELKTLTDILKEFETGIAALLNTEERLLLKEHLTELSLKLRQDATK